MTNEQTDIIIDSGLNKQWNEEYRKLGNKLALHVLQLKKDNITEERIETLHKLAESLFPKAISINKLDIPEIEISLKNND